MSKGELKDVYLPEDGQPKGKPIDLLADFASGVGKSLGKMAGSVRQAASDSKAAKKKKDLYMDISVLEHKATRGGKTFNVKAHRRKRG